MTMAHPLTEEAAAAKADAIAATMDTTFTTILAGNTALLDAVARESLTALAHELHTARRVFLTGAGRSGLIMQLFAIRLGHLGMDVTILGLPIVPPVGPGDLFLAASGSGATASSSALLPARMVLNVVSMVAAMTSAFAAAASSVNG